MVETVFQSDDESIVSPGIPPQDPPLEVPGDAPRGVPTDQPVPVSLSIHQGMFQARMIETGCQ